MGQKVFAQEGESLVFERLYLIDNHPQPVPFGPHSIFLLKEFREIERRFKSGFMGNLFKIKVCGAHQLNGFFKADIKVILVGRYIG